MKSGLDLLRKEVNKVRPLITLFMSVRQAAKEISQLERSETQAKGSNSIASKTEETVSDLQTVPAEVERPVIGSKARNESGNAEQATLHHEHLRISRKTRTSRRSSHALKLVMQLKELYLFFANLRKVCTM